MDIQTKIVRERKEYRFRIHSEKEAREAFGIAKKMRYYAILTGWGKFWTLDLVP